jgi:hypothetical protein
MSNNNFLRRYPTSAGNLCVFSISAWTKFSTDKNSNTLYDTYSAGSTWFSIRVADGGTQSVYFYTIKSSVDYSRYWNIHGDDYSSWVHHLFSFNTTSSDAADRAVYYRNGVRVDHYNDTYGTIPQNYEFDMYNQTNGYNIGRSIDQTSYGQGNIFDYYFVDGQALTPDVFGFNKDGNGYISAGSTIATNFRPGQWVPKKPSVVKNSINNSGRFGVNGFYLPMNDSSNFGADFHCDPNSIIELKGEDLPQPQNGAPTTSDAYVSQLRTDANAANLVLAVPGITGGQGSGYGDYSADIKGSGSNKTVTATGNAGIAATNSYYGSVMTFDGNGDEFNITASSDFDFGSGDFTVESWIYPRVYNSGNMDWIGKDGGVVSNQAFGYGILSNGQVVFYNGDGSTFSNSGNYGLALANGSAPAGQWTHVAAERYGNTFTAYINGNAVGIITNFLGGGSIPNTSVDLCIGADSDSTGTAWHWDGHIQDLRIYKGVAKYKGGFDVAKQYTPVNFPTDAWRAVSDTTANNFATLNTVCTGTDLTYSNGNMTCFSGTSATRGPAVGTIGITQAGTEKYYWEYTSSSTGTDNAMSGIAGLVYDLTSSNYIGHSNTYGIAYYAPSGDTYSSGGGGLTVASYGATYANGDVIGVALDMSASNGSLTFYKNGVSQGVAATGLGTFLTNGEIQAWVPGFGDGSGGNNETHNVNFGQNPTFSGTTAAGTNADDSGKGLFKYAPPSGHLALCEDNLPTPAIADPGDYFKTVLWSGTSTSKAIESVGFKPDFVWAKRRSGSNVQHYLVDSVRGPGIALATSSNNAETTSDNWLRSFDSNGFSVGTSSGWNSDGNDYVAWCWKAGGAAVANGTGSIASQVSANTTSGFSIISYTGNATSGATIGHGLGSVPKMVIVKERFPNTNNWPVYHVSLGNTKAIYLDLTNDAGGAFTGAWNNTTPSSSVITLGNSNETNRSGSPYIAYCWAEIEGYSKFGTYVGNGAADGSFIYCGFKPAWVLIKRNDNAQGGNWTLFDNARRAYNVNNYTLNPDREQPEETNGGNGQVDFLSNGFKCRNPDAGINGSAGNYIFAAFAESPFKTANAK